MFSNALQTDAQNLLAALRRRGSSIAIAESCTGGLIAALMTEFPGASDAVERGFVTYSIDAKIEMLGVRAELIATHGAVSRDVACAMAEGALVHSNADISVAVTGVAGPDGGTDMKPVGLVHIAAGRTGAATLHRECRFGSLSRSEVREKAVAAALALALQAASA